MLFRSSFAQLEEGRARAAAGDFAAAREAFAAAAAGGGLQPDFYCEARLQQAACAARIGQYEEALTVLDELARGAPDVARVEAMRTFVKARQSGRQADAPDGYEANPVPAGP